MSSNPVHALVIVTLASSLAIVVVGVLRKPLRYAVGARAAYWIWLLVPVSVLAVLLPAPVHSVRILAESLTQPVSAAYSAVEVSVNVASASNHHVVVLAIWLLGTSVMLTLLVRRQRAFVRSLGNMNPGSDGLYRGASPVAPLLLGAWRPRIVVPTDFEARYSPEERALVLAHERAHLVRGDAIVNSFATLALCLAWFNPLMYWALGGLRFDQELACDAYVVAGSKWRRRLYADALLKTQLANESTWRVPAGCHWQSTHPLKERVAMLKYSSPGLPRRLCGMAFCLVVALVGSYTVWAAQPEVPLPGSSDKLIAVNMKWWVNGVDMLLPGGPSATRDLRVVSGKEFVRKVSFGEGHTYETQCVASLSSAERKSPVWKTAEAAGQQVEGLILLECKLLQDGKVFATPALLTGESKTARVEMTSQVGAHVRLDFNASTLPERIAGAR
jgi:beta-lactamase regulating signal transducer with metallopeptidase domain